MTSPYSLSAHLDEPPRRWHRWLQLAGAVLLFVVGLQFLRGATAAVAPSLQVFFDRFVRDEWSALGFSWLASYLLTNGSMVAGIALAFFEQDLLSPESLLMALAGTRLGASGIVILIGGFDYFFRREQDLHQACSLGVLSFVVTHAVTLPGIGLAYLGARAARSFPSFRSFLGTISVPLPGEFLRAGIALGESIGGINALLLAVGLLFASMFLFDRALKGLDLSSLRERSLHILSNRWLAALFGFAATALTTSITLSLGLLVPLYNRGHLRDRELTPYILGANVGTFSDTLVIALLLRPAAGLEMAIHLVIGLLVATVVVLVWYAPFRSFTRLLHEWSTRNAVRFGLFLFTVGLAPFLVTFLGWLQS